MTIWQTALLDPPWEERGSGKIKRGAQKHYPLLKTKDMPGVIRESGLWTPAENAHVYCWVTNNFLPDGLWLLNELGARYITNIVWTKKRIGIGRYFRGQHELLLFATIGRGWAVRTAPNDIGSAFDMNESDGEGYFPDGDSIEAEHETANGKRKHSAKPKVFYDMIESRSKGPYVEFFARSLRPEWTSWGNDEAVTVAAQEQPPADTEAARDADARAQPEITPLLSGNAPIRASAAILETLDALGVPHQEGPRQMFEVKVSEEPLPALQGPGILSQLKETFGEVEARFLADPDCSFDLLDPYPHGPLPGGPTRHLPKPDLIPPPRPPSCPHGELRSACVLCRARR